MARMFIGGVTGNLDHYGVPALKAALGQLADRAEVDADRIGAVGFCLGGSIVLTWACTDNRLTAIAPYYGVAPKPREAIRRLCPVVGSWPGKDFTTKAAAILETELTAAGVPHDIKVYPGAKHAFFNDQWQLPRRCGSRLLAAGSRILCRARQGRLGAGGAPTRRGTSRIAGNRLAEDRAESFWGRSAADPRGRARGAAQS